MRETMTSGAPRGSGFGCECARHQPSGLDSAWANKSPCSSLEALEVDLNDAMIERHDLGFSFLPFTTLLPPLFVA